jgi:hypothetical protein
MHQCTMILLITLVLIHTSVEPEGVDGGVVTEG